MQFALRRLCFVFFLVCLTATARAASFVAAPDTLAGHARMVQQLSASLCQKIEAENGKRPLQERSQQEIKDMFQQLMISAMTENSEVMTFVMTQAEAGTDSHAIGEALGRDVVLRLLQECPGSQTLLMRISATTPDDLVQITPEEQPLIKKLTAALCQQFDQQNGAQALATRTAQDRQQLFMVAMSSVLLQHKQEIQQQYGEQVLTDVAAMNKVGRKIALLMAQQCPTYLLQVGQDYVDQQKQKDKENQPAPAPPKAPAAAKKKR